jgi:HSP90 family molecular chaperone
LQDLVKKYSEFINFPIYLWATKEVDVEVPADEEESTEEEDTSKLPVNYYSFFQDHIELCSCNN